MDARMHRRVQRYGWDLAVADYDRYWVPVLTACSERSIALAEPKPGDRVLDVATGTGVAAFIAAERVGPAGEVIATDISEKMVAATMAEAERAAASRTCAASASMPKTSRSTTPRSTSRPACWA